MEFKLGFVAAFELFWCCMWRIFLKEVEGSFSCTPPLGSQIFITCAILVTLLAWSMLLDQNECFSPLVENQVRLQLYPFFGHEWRIGLVTENKMVFTFSDWWQGRNFYWVGFSLHRKHISGQSCLKQNGRNDTRFWLICFQAIYFFQAIPPVSFRNHNTQSKLLIGC